MIKRGGYQVSLNSCYLLDDIVLKGCFDSVGDGDNFRFFHTPTLSGYSWPFKFRRIPSTTKGTRYEHRKLSQPDLDAPLDLKDETLHIRLAGVDAPEVGALVQDMHNGVIPDDLTRPPTLASQRSPTRPKA